MGGASSMHRREVNEEFRRGSLKESEQFGDLEVKVMVFLNGF